MAVGRQAEEWRQGSVDGWEVGRVAVAVAVGWAADCSEKWPELQSEL